MTKTGPKVTVAKVGDPGALSFTSCTVCKLCRTGHPAYCTSFTKLNTGGVPGCIQHGDCTIFGKYFGHSSFGNYALVEETSVVNLQGIVQSAEELQIFAPLGCGFQTGVGTITNLSGAGPSDSVVIMGLGAVG